MSHLFFKVTDYPPIHILCLLHCLFIVTLLVVPPIHAHSILSIVTLLVAPLLPQRYMSCKRSIVKISSYYVVTHLYFASIKTLPFSLVPINTFETLLIAQYTSIKFKNLNYFFLIYHLVYEDISLNMLSNQ